MDRATIEATARDIVVELIGVEADKVTEDASFLDDLGCDSLDLVELCMEFEERFNVAIPDDDMEKCETFGQAVDMVNTKVNG